MILIISLQKTEKECDVCGFQSRLQLSIPIKKQSLIARTITRAVNRSISGQMTVSSILNFSQSIYFIRIKIKECPSFLEGFQVICPIITQLIVDCYQLSCFFYHISPKVHDRIQNPCPNDQINSYKVGELTYLASLLEEDKAPVFVPLALC